MRIFGPCAILAGLLAVLGTQAETKVSDKTIEVPYRLTVPKHILVRAKINGKGPFNFILDTGAPALFVSTKACAKLGIKPDAKGWGTFDRFEIEGGVVIPNAKGRIEDPFQLEGMNGLGLAGAELHGVIGFNILAQYRMEIDLTKDKMKWTKLPYEPAGPKGMGGKGGGGAGGLEIMGSIMKMAGAMMGAKTIPEVALRGYLGLELKGKDETITILSLLEDGPAAKAGLKIGDQIIKVQGRTVLDLDDVHRFSRKLTPGEAVKLTVKRGTETKEFDFKTGEGL